MRLNRDLALVSWREVSREGDFVFMRRGTGETGWWHKHDDGEDYGGNPMDYKRGERLYRCRSCGSEKKIRPLGCLEVKEAKQGNGS